MPDKNPFRHWLAALNAAVAAFLGGGVLAPVLAAAGWTSGAMALYTAYHFACHQWAFRTFFLFGAQPIAAYSQDELGALGAVDPYSFIGASQLGWKMAFCERDLAIYVGLLLVGLLYARRRAMQPAGFGLYAILILPMAADGFTQLFGWRESTWQLRVLTGLLFGLASAWLVFPRLDAAFGLLREVRRYPPSTSCQPPPEPIRQSLPPVSPGV